MADLEQLAQKVREEPRSLAFVAYAEGLRRVGRAEEAWATLREGRRHHSEMPSARLVEARLHIGAGRSRLATEILFEVVHSDPANDGARILLARLLLEESRTSEARAQLVILLMNGVAEAEELAERLPVPGEPALSDDPFDSPALVERWIEVGAYASAIGVWERLHRASPWDRVVIERLGDLRRAASGALVGWIADLPERPFRAIPGRRALEAALMEDVVAPLPSPLPSLQSTPLVRALWPDENEYVDTIEVES